MQEVDELLAELACVSFVLSGQDNAFKVLPLVSSKDFTGYGGSLASIMVAAESISERRDTITYIGVREELIKLRKNGTSAFEALGGDGGLLKIVRAFKVQDGLIKIDSENEAESILATPEIAATIVKKGAAERRLRETITSINQKLESKEIDLSLARIELQQAIVSDDTSTDYPAKSPEDDWDMMEQDIKRLPGTQIGINSGFTGYDNKTGGFLGGDVIEIAALDKQGKSTIALTVANYITKVFGIPCAIFSLEMPRRMIRRRLLAMNSDRRISFGKLMSGRPLSEEDQAIAMEVLTRMSAYPLYIVDNLHDTREIRMEAERLVKGKGVQGIIIDYFQRVSSKTGNREELLTQFSNDITNFTQQNAERNCFTIFLNQLNDQANTEMKIYGTVSTRHAYGSKALNKDSTVLSTISIENEQFMCGCPDQIIKKTVPMGNKPFVAERRKWEKLPTSGFCPDCRQRVESMNPIREGRWDIEKARNFRAGFFVPLLFDGDYMMLDEITEQRITGQLQKIDSVDNFFG